MRPKDSLALAHTLVALSWLCRAMAAEPDFTDRHTNTLAYYSSTNKHWTYTTQGSRETDTYIYFPYGSTGGGEKTVNITYEPEWVSTYHETSSIKIDDWTINPSWTHATNYFNYNPPYIEIVNQTPADVIPDAPDTEYSSGIYYNSGNDYEQVDSKYGIYGNGSTGLAYVFEASASMIDCLSLSFINMAGVNVGHGNLTTYDSNGLAYFNQKDTDDVGLDLTPVLQGRWYSYSISARKFGVVPSFYSSGLLSPAEQNGVGWDPPARNDLVYINGAETRGTVQVGPNQQLAMMCEQNVNVFQHPRFNLGWTWHQDIDARYLLYSPASQMIQTIQSISFTSSPPRKRQRRHGVARFDTGLE